jgi:hypothetical protein
MDVEDPRQPGVFTEHYWSSVAQPIRDLQGHVEMIELSVRDVTPVIAEYRHLELAEEPDGRPRLGPAASVGR